MFCSSWHNNTYPTLNKNNKIDENKAVPEEQII